MATAPRNAGDRPRHPARAVRQPNVDGAGGPPLARLFALYEELAALVPCMGTGYPPGTGADFDSINRLQEQVAGRFRWLQGPATTEIDSPYLRRGRSLVADPWRIYFR